MRILSAEVTNFASYKELKFDFTDKGLSLISGPTGAGKSTLCDVIPWVLFGVTAKGGTVDEIINWNSDTTEGQVQIDLSNGRVLKVYRCRSADKRKNDLYFSTPEQETCRGRDLNDTQKLLNQLLNLTPEAYLSGAYFHEFSQSAAFFISNAKSRRTIIEQIVDLTLVKNLTEKSAVHKKTVTTTIAHLEKTLITSRALLQGLEKNLKSETELSDKWKFNHQRKLKMLHDESANFEAKKQSAIETIRTKFIKDKAKLEFEMQELEAEILPAKYFTEQEAELEQRRSSFTDTPCQSCGASPKHSVHKLMLNKDEYELKSKQQANEQKKIQLKSLASRLQHQELLTTEAIAREEASKNVYTDNIKDLKKEANEHENSAKSLTKEILDQQNDINDFQAMLNDEKQTLSDIELLQDITGDLRGALVKSTVVNLEKYTNKLLTDYFDAEIRVTFELEDADKIDVVIYKDGNLCSYSQLSKGQRQLLKLSFGLSVMRSVQMHNHTSFSAIFLDEALDGLDDELKLKAYRLLQNLSLEYESVFVVEHNQAFKTMFNRNYKVELVNGASELEEA